MIVVPIDYLKNLSTSAYLLMFLFVVASLLIQHHFITFDSPKSLIIRGKMNEALQSVQRVYVTRDLNEAEEILQDMARKTYIEQDNLSVLDVAKNPKYKKVTKTLISNMFMSGLNGNFRLVWAT